MRILHISNYFFPHIGGIEQVARDIVNTLTEHEQKLICFNHEKGTKKDRTPLMCLLSKLYNQEVPSLYCAMGDAV